MSDPVARAFDQLRASKVDCSPDELAFAQERRRQLETQLRQLATESPAFPQLSNEPLALDPLTRATQIQPLTQLEIWLPLRATGTQATPSPLNSQTCWLKINSVDAPLSLYPDTHGYVSSTEVLVSLRNGLTSLPNCQSVDLDATKQAILLEQLGINESFKIIPTIPVDNPTGERIYYLIPDGTGNWTRQKAALTVEGFEQLDKRHQGNFRPTVRLLKYWNRQSVELPEEDWEWLALKVFQQTEAYPSLAIAIAEFFARCPALLVHPSFEFSPEGIELNKRWGAATLEGARSTMETAATPAQTAIRYEEQGEFESAIAVWRQIFKEL